MKIFTANQIRQADRFTIENEPITSINLMERAARLCTKRILNGWSNNNIDIYCGNGNNGGDGLAMARQLSEKDIKVRVVLLMEPEKGSPDFRENLEQLIRQDKANIINAMKEPLPDIKENQLIIDAIFGSGLSRAPEGMPADAIQHINQGKAIVISIDVPSGMAIDTVSPDYRCIIQADHTLSFSPVKLCLLQQEHEQFCGQWELIDIGHHPRFIEEQKTTAFFVQNSMVAGMIPPRGKYTHKGTYGHALLMAGSTGKSGAAAMASMACHRAGCGLLTACVNPSVAYSIECHSPETMILRDPSPDFISSLPSLQVYNAVGFGPGIGCEKETTGILKLLIQECRVPLVLDADALNILAENKTWLGFLPKNTILTPHPGEFVRMFGKSANSFEQKEYQKELSVRYGVIIILKGAHTSISTPDGQIFFNSTGNPGMATAGSGDVLTGLLLGLLARGLSPVKASIAGVFLHGLAGDLAAEKTGYEALTATSIISEIGKAFKECIPLQD